MQLMRLVLLALLIPTSAFAQWANEPAGSTQVLDCPFSQLPTYPITYCGIENFYHAGVLSTESVPQMVSPGGAFKSALAAGQRVGGSQLNYVLPSINREMFVGVKWRTNPEFQGRSGGNKTFFMRGPDSIGVFVIQGGLASGSGPFVWSHNSGALNNNHVCSASIGELCYPNVSSGIVQRGVWTTLEAYIKASTTNTSRDGIVRWWINGVLAGNYTNINYAGAGLNEWIWTETWDGCGGFNPCDLGTVNTQNWEHYIDHLHVSVPNCPSGCGGGGGGDTTPPSQVTGLGAPSINGTSAGLIWSAASDNVGVTGYLVEKCTPHNCTNWAVDQVSTGLSATVTGLTSGVTYDFRVRATDAAGNLGSYSAIVSGTTSSEVARTLATDDFNRANGALGANWTGSYSGSPDLTIVSNATRGTATTGDNLMTYTAVSTPADQWAQVDVATATGAGLYAGGVTLRTAASPLSSYYMCRMQTNGWAGTMIERLVNGTYTLLASSAPATWVVGDTLKCTARANVITLSRIRSGVESVMLTATDGTHTTGKTGVITYADTVANFGFDNFLTGDWTVAAAAPTISSFTPDTTGANITWTGSPAYIRVQTYTDSGIFSDVVEPIASFPDGRYTHTWELGITSGCVFAQDASHVQNSNPSDYKCNTITPAPPADTTPPVLSSLLPSGTLPQGTTSTTISVVTNETATCKYSDTDQAYASMSSSFSTANGTSHSATKSSLTNGSSYTVYVRCLDVAGNANTSSGTIAFSVASAPAADTTPPSTVAGLSAVALSTSQIQAAWTAATDNVAVASYRLYACVGTGCSDYALVASPVGTSATIAGLIASTVYRLVVDAIDTSGNISAAHSSAYEVTTPGNVDIVPPSTLMNLRESVSPIYNQASLAWDAGTDNVGISQTLLERCAGLDCEDFQTIRSVSGTTFSDTSVQFGTTYRYRGKHRDTSGNVSTNYSSILSVVVPAPPVGVTAGVCPCKTH